MKKFGYITSESSSSRLKIAAYADSANIPVVGRTVFVDIELEDGFYRALGTVTDISTRNTTLANSNFAIAASKGATGNTTGTDTREFTLKIQSTFYRANENDPWSKASSAFPTSPATKTEVALLGEEQIAELVADDDDVVFLGTMRGLPGVSAPLTVPNFSSQRGAAHSAIVGKSGSGKTSFSTFLLSSQMSHEDHAIIIIDPQGQWSNENGFLFSPQKFAAALGREVSVLRVSEDIQLPMNETILGRLFDHVDLWGRGFQRMGNENKQAFSDEVADRIARKAFSTKGGLAALDPKTMLSDIFASIAKSNSTLRRIYASDDRVDALRRTLQLLAGITPVIVDKDGNENEELIEDEEWEDVASTWNRLLPRFIPLINLFSTVNLNNGKRRALGGPRGFLTDVMQVRSADPAKPAPYVILDMSSDVTTKAKGDYAAATKAGDESEILSTQMRVMLDNDEIKALIVSTVLDEIKASSEEAFAAGNGNLNTQIVFDEAWRYAPNVAPGQSDTPIGKLTAQLEGFALDTRKYGIGWTYILQSPSDLNRGIWRQLSFVYTAYGIIGADKKMLGDLMDEKERDAQMGLYDQFAPPASTGRYPFMLNGPVSPLIFTNTPVFIDAYNSIGDFIFHNKEWIDRIVARRNLIPVNAAALAVGGKSARKPNVGKEPVSFRIGASPKVAPASKPQSVVELTSAPRATKVAPVAHPETNEDFLVDEPPF